MTTDSDAINIACPRGDCLWVSGMGRQDRVALLLYEHIVAVHPTEEGIVAPDPRAIALYEGTLEGEPDPILLPGGGTFFVGPDLDVEAVRKELVADGGVCAPLLPPFVPWTPARQYYTRLEEDEVTTPGDEEDPEWQGITGDGYLILKPATQMQHEFALQLFRCWRIMQERSAKYDEAWYKQGAMMNLAECIKLMDRIKAVLWDNRDGPPMSERDYDDVDDLVNYALAFRTQANLGQF